MPVGRTLTIAGRAELVDRSSPPRPGIPDHVRESIETGREVNRKHEERATAYDRGVDTVTSAMSRPLASGLVSAIILVWIGANLVLGHRSFDPRPFSLLSTTVSVMALVMTILVLTAQRRADRLADQRQQLLLQLARINDAKLSKVVEMLQQLRADHPELSEFDDPRAAAMAQPVDTTHLLDVHSEEPPS